MIIRKRIFGYDGESSVNLRSSDLTAIATNMYRIPQAGTDILYRLHAIDVVDYIKDSQIKRVVICTDVSEQIGLIHHLPPTVIYPSTKHEKIIRQKETGLLFGKNEVSLVESSAVEIVGIERDLLSAVNPRYSFEDRSDMRGFEDTLRGKHILHTLEVEIIKSNRGPEARAQHLKIWSAVDDGQVSLSFYSHEVEPKCHFELPLTYFEPVVTFRGDTIIKIGFKYKAPRKRSLPFRRRSSLKSFGHSSKDSTTTSLEGSNTPQSDESAVSMQSDESSFLGQVFTTIGKMGYLEIEFTKPEGLTSFTEELKRSFSRAPAQVPVPFPESPPPGPRPRTSLRRPPSTSPPPPETDAPPIMFRVQGIPYSCLNGGTRHLIRRALGLQEDAEITTRSLAVSPDPAKLTAVIYFKNVPEQLSSEEFLKMQELKVSFSTVNPVDESESHEWITIDTHFRNLTVLRTVKPSDGHEHTVDICAVSGLGAHAWGSFRERKGKFMWLKDSLPEKFKGARIMTYGFETKLRNNNSIQSLRDLARYLLSDLENARASLRSPTAIPLVFIAHSLGGLVVKEAMIHAKLLHKENFISSINGSLFFGVPSEGMDINSLRPLVQGQPNEALLESLERGSTTLSVQNTLYAGFFEDYLKPPVAFFYENKLSPTAREIAPGRWKLDGPQTHLVSASSATCGYYNKNSHICQSMEKNHSELVKFNGPHDGEYLHVLPILKQFIPES
ncbi:hypothetical protein F5884DRAFT_469713 [Xylogone sp. PMI_703]|nr:hypothetical protein F5884DRAFT_469713 [Xylogone sp. PMI_703]